MELVLPMAGPVLGIGAANLPTSASFRSYFSPVFFFSIQHGM